MLTQHFRCEVVGIRLTFAAINRFRNGESMSFEVTVDGRDKLVVDDSSANRLGGGSQGEVFVVTYHNKKYALKWYTSPYIKKNRAFRENLRRNTMKEAPDCCFVWPQHFAENNKSFGYLMDIIDTNRFTLFSNLYTGKKRIKDPKTGKKITVDVGFDSVEPQITAAINLANAFRSLHRAGMAYLDINDGGFYIDVKTGDLLVCDCDNISGSSNNECKLVLGTSGYLAPELVDDPDCGLPNMDTDKHSLAVLLFMLLIWGKPFDGKLLSGVMVSKSNEKDFYGTKTAVFVYHPTNSNNRPISSNSNVLKFWKEMTPAVQKYFTQCFTEGITKPTKRPTENRWTQALNSLRAGFVKCPCGGGEEYANEKNLKKNQYCCPHCRKAYHTLYFPGNGDRYPLMRGKKIFAVSIGAESIHQTIGDVGEKKSGKDIIIGMVNSSNMDWNIIDGGKTYVVNPGRGFPLNKGTMIEFRYKEKSGKDELVRTGKGVVE